MLREGLVEVFQTPASRFSGGGSIASRYLQDRPAAIISPVCGRAPNVASGGLPLADIPLTEGCPRGLRLRGGRRNILEGLRESLLRGAGGSQGKSVTSLRELSAALLTAREGPSDSPPLVDHLATGLGFHTVAKTPALALPGGGADSDFHRSAQSLDTTLN